MPTSEYKYADEQGLSALSERIFEKVKDIVDDLPGGGGSGNVNAIIAADYSSASTYAVNDYCMHQGSLYRCIAAISTPEAWNSTHWANETLTEQITTFLNIPIVDNMGY